MTNVYTKLRRQYLKCLTKVEISKMKFILSSITFLLIAMIFIIPVMIIAILALPYMLLAKSVKEEDSGFSMYGNLFLVPIELVKDEINLYKTTFRD